VSASTPPEFQFEVALSFAGDGKRTLVRNVAELLRRELGDGKVFFDEWFEAELAGHDASNVLQKIYLTSTRLVVSGICKRYAEKPWTQDEWRAIQAFERRLRPGDAGGSLTDRNRFLPLRFGDGEVDGLFETAIVPDVRNRTPEQIAGLILDRWRLTQKESSGHSIRPSLIGRAIGAPLVGSTDAPARPRWQLSLLAAAVLAGLGVAAIYWRPGLGKWLLARQVTRDPPPNMVLVPAADVTMGSTETEVQQAFELCRRDSSQCDRDKFKRETPARRVRVTAFYLDRTERTNGEVVAWLSSAPDLDVETGWARVGGVPAVNLTAQSSPLRADQKSVVIDRGRPGLAQLPATYITHAGARAFCRARGLDLPTEAQWERAARGSEGRRFAWGDRLPTCDQAIFARAPGGACASRDHGPVSANFELDDRTPEGVLHLSGNVSEWVLDRFDLYASCAEPCVNPFVPPTTSANEWRVIRGGSADAVAEQLRGAARSRWPADEANRSTGFRCAGALEPDPR
jgi:formylglycine-generating enzyme required for sulfatase activity